MDKLDSDLKVKKKIESSEGIKKGFEMFKVQPNLEEKENKKFTQKSSTLKRSTTLGPSTETQIIKSSRRESIFDQHRARDRERNLKHRQDFPNDESPLSDKQKLQENAKQKAQKSQEILKVLKAGVFKDLTFARRRTTGGMHEPHAFRRLLSLSKEEKEEEAKRNKIKHELIRIGRSPVLKLDQKEIMQRKLTKQKSKLGSKETSKIISRKAQSSYPTKPGTAQDKVRPVLIYTGSEKKVHFDPLGERKKEDDIALTLRNLSMSKTIQKSKEAERSTQIRLIEAHMEMEKDRKQALKNDKPDEDDQESIISSDDCEDEEAKFRLLKGTKKNEHLIMLWKKAYLKSRGGSLIQHFYKDLSRKIYLFGISRKLEDIEALEKPDSIFVIQVGSKLQSYWNVINILLLLYTAIYMPFRIAFIDQETTSQIALDWTVDSLFMTDIIINFFSAYEEEDGSMQQNLKKIATTYVRSWFVADFVACFPFQLFDQQQMVVDINSQKTSYQKLLRLMRLPRLYRFLKIMKILKSIKILQEQMWYVRFMNNLKMNGGLVRMIQGVIATIAITHLFACFWFLTAKIDDFTPDTWVVRMGIVDQDNFTCYIYSLYWAVQTVITLGYGDIPAYTTWEILLSLFWMLFGEIFYSFIVATYTSIISGNIENDANIQIKIKSYAELAKQAGIPFELSKKIKKFIENNYETIYSKDNEEAIIKMLPPSLRDEVRRHTYGDIVEKIKFLREMEDVDFLWKLLPLLTAFKIEKTDVIYWKDDHAEDSTITLYTDKGNPFIKYRDGDTVGDSDTLLNKPRDCKAVATTHIKMMLLKINEDFEVICRDKKINIVEMVLDARKKREYHLTMMGEADQKAKKESMIQMLLNNKNMLHQYMTNNEKQFGILARQIIQKSLEINMMKIANRNLRETIKKQEKAQRQLEQQKAQIQQMMLMPPPVNDKGARNSRKLKAGLKEDDYSNTEADQSKRSKSGLSPRHVSPIFDRLFTGLQRVQKQYYSQPRNEIRQVSARGKRVQANQEQNFGGVQNDNLKPGLSKKPNLSGGKRKQSTLIVGNSQKERVIKENRLSFNLTPNANKNQNEEEEISPKLDLKQVNREENDEKNDTQNIEVNSKERLINGRRQSTSSYVVGQSRLKSPLNGSRSKEERPQSHQNINQNQQEEDKRNKKMMIIEEGDERGSNKSKNSINSKNHNSTKNNHGSRAHSRGASQGKKQQKETQIGGAGVRELISLSNQVIEEIQVREEKQKQEEIIRKTTMKSGFYPKSALKEMENQRVKSRENFSYNSRAATPQHGSRQLTPLGVKRGSVAIKDLRDSINLTSSFDSKTINSLESSREVSRKNTQSSKVRKIALNGPLNDKQIKSLEEKKQPIVNQIQIKQLDEDQQKVISKVEIQPSIQISRFSQKVVLKSPINSRQRSISYQQTENNRRTRAQSLTKIIVKRLSINTPNFNEEIKEQRIPRMQLQKSNNNQKEIRTQFISPLALQRLTLDQQSKNLGSLTPQHQTQQQISGHQKTDFYQLNNSSSVINLLPSQLSQNNLNREYKINNSLSRTRVIQETVSQAFKQTFVKTEPKELEKKTIDPESFAGYIQKDKQRTNSKQVLKEKADSNKTTALLDDLLLDTQDGNIQLRPVGSDFQTSDIYNQMRQQVAAEFKRKIQDTIQIQSAVPAVIQNPSDLSQPYYKQQNSRIKVEIKEELIDFFGEPKLEGLVRFNADMGHISLNIFETFTAFDLIQKSNQCLFESLQLIESQNSIIEQRQDNIEHKLEELEQQLLKIKELKGENRTKRQTGNPNYEDDDFMRP